MGSFAESIQSIQATLPSPAVQTPIMDPSWMAKLAKSGSELKSIKSSIDEEVKAYASTMIPQTIPNTTAQPNAGSLAAAIDAGTKQAEVMQDLNIVPGVKSQLDSFINSSKTAIETNKNQALAQLDTSKAKLNAQTDRSKRLYASKALAQIDEAKEKAVQDAQAKKELISYE